jgi:hypothetical protein
MLDTLGRATRSARLMRRATGNQRPTGRIGSLIEVNLQGNAAMRQR